jgi:hypothetical protein
MNRYEMLQEAKEKMSECEPLQKLSPQAQAIYQRMAVDGFLLMEEAGRTMTFKLIMMIALSLNEAL